MKKGIPEEAKKVFEGVLFSVWQWEQEQFDGSFKTFEMLSHPDSATVIATTTRGTILLLQEEQPGREAFISLPAGSSEQGEDVEEAGKRELLEETGYASDMWEVLTETGFGSKFAYINTIFIAKNCQRVTEQKLDSGERIIVLEIDFEQLIALKDNSRFRNKDMLHILEKAAGSSEFKEELRQKIFNSV